MQHPFEDESPHLGHLADLVSQIVDVDASMRALGARRDTLLAQAYRLAEREGLRVVGVAPGSAAEELASQALTVGPGRPVGLPRGAVVRRDRAHRVVRAEIAAALHVPESHVSRDIAHAVDALEWCPKLHKAQAAGDLTTQHVRTVVDAGRIILQHAAEQLGGTLVDADGVLLGEEAAGIEVARRYKLYEAAVLPYALAQTPPLLAPVAKRLAEKVAGVTFNDRHRSAKQYRRVWLTELEDGMCNLTTHLTSVEAHAVFDQLTQHGKRLQQTDVSASSVQRDAGAADTGPTGVSTADTGRADALAPRAAREAMKRPLPEARADSLVALLLEGQVPETDGRQPRLGPRVSARIQVLVPVSLTGRLGAASTGTGTGTVIDDGWFQPELVGVGPIDTDTAQRIAHDTPTWDTVIVDDSTGSENTGDVLSVEGYRVPAKLRNFLAARDEHCRFTGCGLPTYRCDIDHTIAAEDGGPTATDNLGYLCRGHHILKHHGNCLVVQDERGVYEWTYPSGRVYREPPPSRVAFRSALGEPDLQLAQQHIRSRLWRDGPDPWPGSRSGSEPEPGPGPERPNGSPPDSPPPW